ncbi:hypothetical protein HaGV_gp041 [Helicoverpa armigera granulovirus]|uniref:RING-type domain-containing protein n=1 Tax=Helicoverpa armigera granulovirus TaxID=489830 RepID=A9YMN3_9BBAC|nr:hypothetical protein HaGV_gp041 [Helicoverpa armigera granulovirus]ABY47732.1 unknown [Helicoverpa armigera granulovirus]
MLVLQCGHIVCVYCKKHLDISMECPLCKAFPVNSYILSAKPNLEPVSTDYNIVRKLITKNPYPVNRVYEVFELLPVSTVYHVDNHLYTNKHNNGISIVNKLIQFENTTIREIKPAFVPLIDEEQVLQTKIDKLFRENKILTAKMLHYKLKCDRLKQPKRLQ